MRRARAPSSTRAIAALVAATVGAGVVPAAIAQPKQAQPSSATTATKPAPPPASASAKPPAPSATTTPAHASAIVRVASDLAQGLAEVPAGALVVASPVASDVTAPKGDELAIRIAAQVAGKLGVARAHPQPAPLAVARGHAGRAASLVYLQIEIVKGELRVTADLYPVVSNGWERLRNPVPGPRAHAFASAPLDAEIRSFLSPLVLEQVTLHKAKHDEGELLAIGCGDLDGDGGNEIVLVSRARVAVGKLRAGKFVASKTAAWSELASRVPVPMREPLASVQVAPATHRGELLVGTTERGAVALDASLVTKRQLTGLPVAGGDGETCARPLPAEGAFDGDAVACTAPAKGEPPSTLTPPLARYDAIATFDAIARDGGLAEVTAVREPNGRLRVRRHDPGAAKPIEVTIENAGAQIAIVDLDLDGIPEIVTTTENDADMLVVSSFTRAQLVARLRYPAKEGVRAVAACPPEERGVPAIVAAVGSGEVWLVR
ncbi:MAG TPA: hypothetical protein VIF62_27755 [Labilithrix sp.]|jgi:hypothetical protein